MTPNPFNTDDENFHSLSTGVVAVHGKDAANCDETEIIGSKILEDIFSMTENKCWSIKNAKCDLVLSISISCLYMHGQAVTTLQLPLEKESKVS